MSLLGACRQCYVRSGLRRGGPHAPPVRVGGRKMHRRLEVCSDHRCCFGNVAVAASLMYWALPSSGGVLPPLAADLLGPLQWRPSRVSTRCFCSSPQAFAAMSHDQQGCARHICRMLRSFGSIGSKWNSSDDAAMPSDAPSHADRHRAAPRLNSCTRCTPASSPAAMSEMARM